MRQLPGNWAFSLQGDHTEQVVYYFLVERYFTWHKDFELVTDAWNLGDYRNSLCSRRLSWSFSLRKEASHPLQRKVLMSHEGGPFSLVLSCSQWASDLAHTTEVPWWCLCLVRVLRREPMLGWRRWLCVSESWNHNIYLDFSKTSLVFIAGTFLLLEQMGGTPPYGGLETNKNHSWCCYWMRW